MPALAPLGSQAAPPWVPLCPPMGAISIVGAGGSLPLSGSAPCQGQPTPSLDPVGSQAGPRWSAFCPLRLGAVSIDASPPSGKGQPTPALSLLATQEEPCCFPLFPLMPSRCGSLLPRADGSAEGERLLPKVPVARHRSRGGRRLPSVPSGRYPFSMATWLTPWRDDPWVVAPLKLPR